MESPALAIDFPRSINARCFSRNQRKKEKITVCDKRTCQFPLTILPVRNGAPSRRTALSHISLFLIEHEPSLANHRVTDRFYHLTNTIPHDFFPDPSKFRLSMRLERSQKADWHCLKMKDVIFWTPAWED